MEINKKVDIINKQQLDFEPAMIYMRNGIIAFYKRSSEKDVEHGKWLVYVENHGTWLNTEEECRIYIMRRLPFICGDLKEYEHGA